MENVEKSYGVLGYNRKNIAFIGSSHIKSIISPK